METILREHSLRGIVIVGDFHTHKALTSSRITRQGWEQDDEIYMDDLSQAMSG